MIAFVRTTDGASVRIDGDSIRLFDGQKLPLEKLHEFVAAFPEHWFSYESDWTWESEEDAGGWSMNVETKYTGRVHVFNRTVTRVSYAQEDDS